MTALVYLHGFSSGPGGSKGTFTRKWAEHRGIPFWAPDLNLPTFETLTVTAQVAAVETLLASLPQPPVLVGSSMGGFVATAVAHRGAALRALILLAPAIHFGQRRLASPAWAPYWERGEMEVFHYAAGAPRRLGPQLGEDLVNWMDDATWRIPVPTTILHGRADTLVPLEVSEAYVGRNPHAVLHVLDDGHELLRLETLARLRGELEAAFA
ncbi:MAG TPA: YqiA/YcfP family alpha/beta fold hydrolase [Holophagaceae bacterium]|nr:YqiA/YcfP family alpha/beta fold hydrolase [Holophagaceae bacterium]